MYMGDYLIWSGGVPVPDVAPPGAPPVPDFGLCPDGSPATSVGCSTSSTEEQPVTPIDTGTSTSPYTLPIEIFNQTIPQIIQAGGVPTIESPIPTTLPGTTAPPPSNKGQLYLAEVLLGVIGLLALTNLTGRKRR